MNASMIKVITRIVLASAVLCLTQACTGAPGVPQAGVADAYETSGLVTISPYTRTIFSSNNF
jgi:type IV pilus biogenesis protein CpaD/CtpE